jgi:hypothetical protein
VVEEAILAAEVEEAPKINKIVKMIPTKIKDVIPDPGM